MFYRVVFEMEREQKASLTHIALWLVPNIFSGLTSQKIKKYTFKTRLNQQKKVWQLGRGRGGKKAVLKIQVFERVMAKRSSASVSPVVASTPKQTRR